MLGAHFGGTRILYLMQKSARAKVADGRERPTQKKTWFVHVTVLTPRVLVEEKLTLAVLLGLPGDRCAGCPER